jgi:hypothetical protein
MTQKIYILFNKDDYFARDALVGEIEHHNKNILFTNSIDHHETLFNITAADGVIIIIGANTKNLDLWKEEINHCVEMKKPILTILSHSSNAVDTSAYKNVTPVIWEWNTIAGFIEQL